MNDPITYLKEAHTALAMAYVMSDPEQFKNSAASELLAMCRDKLRMMESERNDSDPDDIPFPFDEEAA